MAVLPDHQDPVGVIQGEHGHCTGMKHHVPFGQMIFGGTDLVAAYGDQLAADQLRRGGDGPVLGLVLDDHAVAAARAPARLLAEARALDRASAAAIRPSNSGCGRVGRDRNSGCAWVPTKNGWLGSSANSTRCPSGESPEKTSPASSNPSR